MFNIMANWWEDVWQAIVSFFESTVGFFDDFLNGIFNIDVFLLTMYNDHVAGLPVLVKWLGALFVAFILVLGTISLIKKSIKLVIIIAIIILVFFVFSR